MKKIPSFTVNHLTLRRGVYVSRQDRVGDEIVTTFDVRMKAPNREPALHVNAIHTMEHLAANLPAQSPRLGRSRDLIRDQWLPDGKLPDF